ncbi:hypothetical protein NLI96_g11063 [Meripilus lineatus]|uniref:Uncharacterized protein n=1 Tax=Meripilus lineatus TaxID=2056292 RepID=A0AAD5YBD1_9APHY|nr:hypothetical protein NLI96_g11063 [Physisporinus lineatus]
MSHWTHHDSRHSGPPSPLPGVRTLFSEESLSLPPWPHSAPAPPPSVSRSYYSPEPERPHHSLHEPLQSQPDGLHLLAATAAPAHHLPPYEAQQHEAAVSPPLHHKVIPQLAFNYSRAEKLEVLKAVDKECPTSEKGWVRAAQAYDAVALKYLSLAREVFLKIEAKKSQGAMSGSEPGAAGVLSSGETRAAGGDHMDADDDLPQSGAAEYPQNTVGDLFQQLSSLFSPESQEGRGVGHGQVRSRSTAEIGRFLAQQRLDNENKELRQQVARLQEQLLEARLQLTNVQIMLIGSQAQGLGVYPPTPGGGLLAQYPATFQNCLRADAFESNVAETYGLNVV